ncbi:MAG TPA: hypothetical protein VFQ43_00785 [Nitrososphaera sp.]|nr:hypothetical protein [Nitrososphaera sp.]
MGGRQFGNRKKKSKDKKEQPESKPDTMVTPSGIRQISAEEWFAGAREGPTYPPTRPIKPMQPETGRKPTESNHFNFGDSVGLAALIVTVLSVTLTPPLPLKIVLLCFSAVGCFVFLHKSHWTHTWSGLVKNGAAGMLIIAVSAVAVPQLISQWRNEPPAQTSGDSSHAVGFQALDTEIGNLPERQKVSLTWNGKPWDEQQYSDVRLTINNNLDYQIQNSDLAISAMDGEEHLGIAGIGQLSDVSGVEFHPPLTQWPQLRLRGKDGKDYVFDATDMLGNKWLPAREFRIFCPRLLPNEPLRLIIATVRDNGNKKPATSLHIKGTYETAQSEGSMRRKLDQTIVIEQ